MIKANYEIISGSYSVKNGTITIAEYAFDRCKLTSINIPSSVTNIANEALLNCGTLTSINVDSGNAVYDSRENCNAIIKTSTNELIAGCQNTVIPKSVTSIGQGAFCSCTGLTSITIPNSVTSIGRYAFSGCTGLTSIEIPNAVTSIGDLAFEYCTDLERITIGNSVTSIGKRTFSGCTDLTQINWNAKSCADFTSSSNIFYNAGTTGNGITVSFGDLVEKIPAWLFMISEESYRPKITTVDIGKSVTSIGDYAFGGCTNLSKANYLGTISQWCSIEFANEYSNPTTYAENLYINNVLVTNVIIPNSITEIKPYAFYHCTGIVSITIPESISSIGKMAFYYCVGITQINWNAKNCADFEPFYSYAFYYVGKAGSGVTVAFGDSVERIPAYLGLSWNIVSITIGKNVKTIGDEAFSGCGNITSITIPNSITSIGDYAFVGCTNLSKVNYLGTISQWCSIEFANEYSNPTMYAENLYINNVLVTNVIIPNSVTEIKPYTFYNCTGITSITIPDSVASMGEYAFYGVNSSISVLCKASSPIADELCSCGFSLISSTCPNYVIKVLNEKNNNTYIRLVAYLGKEKEISIPNNIDDIIVKSIGPSIFKNYKDITKLVISNEVTEICEYAFFECVNLENVEVGVRVQTIGEKAFYGCSGIVSMSMPSGCSSIGLDAFYHIQNVCYIGCATGSPWGAYNINKYIDGNFVYSDSSKTTLCGCGTQAGGDIVIPSTVISISERAFENCDKITSVTIPDNVSNIGTCVFFDCDKLETVTVVGGSIGASSFESCDNLTTLELGNGITNVKEKAFYNCTNLANIKLCCKDTKFEKNSFLNDENIESVSYVGTYEDRYNMVIDSGNDYFINAVWSYSYNVPEELNSISKIELKNLPSKITYQKGESLNTEGLKLTATFCDGTIKEITTGFSCTNTLFTTTGTKTVTVLYQGKTTTFSVTVTEPIPSLLAISVIANPSKLTYKVGNTLDASGLKLSATYSDGTSKEITSGYTCSPTALTSAGVQIITVTYEGKTAIFNVTVSNESSDPSNPVAGIVEKDVIKGNAANNQKTYDYKTSVTFTANVPEGGSVQWYVDNKPAGNGATLSVGERDSSYTVQVVVTDKNGNKSGDTENVTIKNSFWDKIVYFFKHLFNPNAYIVNQ